ncbi:MAG: hypothetical protein J6D18_03195 [Erysipelotrichaceae bacterium]|nr:hypothetical protein [Erysipelotrichaceae bacterium]
MKKFFLVSFLFLLTLSRCYKETLTVKIEDSNSIQITANTAGKNEGALLQGFVVNASDQLILEPFLDEGTLTFRLYPDTGLNKKSSRKELESFLKGKKPVFEKNLSGVTMNTAQVPAGTYIAQILIKNPPLVGKTSIYTQSTLIQPDMAAADSAQEAAEKAGLDHFQPAEGLDISLGTIQPFSYLYGDGLVKADIVVSKTQMYILKGTASFYDGDVSLDSFDYPHSWTQQVGDIEVTCYGNTKGKAVKTIWTKGDAAYAVDAYGKDGKEDGLNAEDITKLVNHIQ